MAHLWGLDTATPPAQSVFNSLAQQGVGFFGGYSGGIARTNPTYEQGVMDGNACLGAMHERGLSGWVIADMENGGGAARIWTKEEFGRIFNSGMKINNFWVGPGGIAVDWFRGYTDAVHGGSCQVQLYGTPDYIDAMGQYSDSWYLAFWPAPNQTERPFPKPDWDIWQYSTGPVYDYSVAVDWWPFTGYTP